MVKFGRLGSMIALLLAPLLLAACNVADGGRGDVRPMSAQEFGPPDAPSVASVAQDYRIGVLDTLSVSVFQIPDLSGDRQVETNGKITMPLIGEVDAIGLTASQLAQVLQTKLGDKYLQSPQVQVVVKDAVAQRITVDGSVKQPGVYPIKGSTTLIQAVALARGLDDGGRPDRVAVFRTVKGKRLAAGFDLNKIRKGEQPDPDLYGNDVIVVDGSRTRKAFRDIISSVPILAIFGAF